MTLETWLAFAIASSALLIVPGPTITIVVSYALGKGPSSGWVTVPGTVVGDFTAMTLSLAGAGAILAASATLFTALKLCGAAYLIWLGIRLWRADPSAERISGERRNASRHSMFWNCYVVTALNPIKRLSRPAGPGSYRQPGRRQFSDCCGADHRNRPTRINKGSDPCYRSAP
jgi:threonine/homoserine/homoserine lactone efflux protein